VTKSANSAAKASPDKATSRRPWLLVFIFRVLLLAVGGGVALISGIVFAHFYPNPNPEKPLLIKGLERFDNKTPATSPNVSPTLGPDSTNPQSQLTPVQKQEAQAKLTQLQGQLQLMSNSVASLEEQLGSRRPNDTLEGRLQAISLELQGLSASSSNVLSMGNGSTNQAATVSESLFQVDKLKVTLPSDVLFEQSNSVLRQEAGLILDKIVADLRNYPASTIRIGAHTDAQGEAEDNRELSFRRAKSVEQYLARTLGKQYRWLVVGYGETRPLVANDTNANEQRNRRVEIAVN
jgi:outer membrane protein OmpA-like peptidoglycan-associated protein